MSKYVNRCNYTEYEINVFKINFIILIFFTRDFFERGIVLLGFQKTLH